MAYFNAASSAVGVDMGNVSVSFGTVTLMTAQKITISAGAIKQDYLGVFSYPNNSVAGTLTGTSYANTSTGGSYSVSGFSTDATTAASYINSGNVQPLITSVLSGADSIIGSNGKDRLFGYDGNDQFIGLGGDDYIDGGAGIDTAAYSGNRSSLSFLYSSGSVVVQDNSGNQGFDVLSNVERISFNDGSVAFDISGNAGQAYRLYQAAFARTPDKGGLGTWINYMDQGHTLKEVSALFQQSAEFVSRYSANPSVNEFVTLLYQNVLHRAPDAGGMNTWTTVLNTNQWSRADVLIGFSESTENKAALIGVQSAGMEFIPAA